MALKRTLAKTEYDALPADVKKEYVDNGDGEFSLDVEGIEDVGPLKRTVVNVKREKTELANKIAEMQTKLDTLEAAAASTNGKEKTPKQIESEWKKKLDDETGVLNTKLASVLDSLKQTTAERIATEMFTSKTLGKKYVQDRISVKFDDDGKPQVIILDEAGNETDVNIDNFKKELRANKDLATVLVGSRASGGGATGVQGHSGGGATGGKKFSELNDTERRELYLTNPVEFQRLRSENIPARRVV
jgi:hypothetical protein